MHKQTKWDDDFTKRKNEKMKNPEDRCNALHICVYCVVCTMYIPYWKANSVAGTHIICLNIRGSTTSQCESNWFVHVFIHIFKCGYDVKVQWTHASVCNHRYTELIDIVQTVMKHTRTHICTYLSTYLPTKVWRRRYAQIAWYKSDYNLSTAQTEDEQKRQMLLQQQPLGSAFCVFTALTKYTQKHIIRP